MSIDAVIAANRFGLGASPGQLVSLGGDPKAWLIAQTRTPTAAIIASRVLPNTAQAYANYREYTQARRAQRLSMQTAMPGVDPADMAVARSRSLAQPLLNLGGGALGEDIEARITHALTTPSPFLERWTLFWSNALTMTAKNQQTTHFVGPYEREAIRPHVLGKYADLLKASALHAGMLIYLDQVRSTGPNAPSMVGRPNRRSERRPGASVGLNENLAREILELHTLGSDGGYSQADVTEFARALTGWTIITQPNLRRANTQTVGQVAFMPALHEPGARTIMGRVFEDTGGDQARMILDWLARQPQTARRIATAIAVHFVSDIPPPSLINRLERAFIQSDGDLATMAQVLINSSEAWVVGSTKFKSPSDFLISTLRASSVTSVSAASLRSTFAQLGQSPWRAPSPKGWPDTVDKWASPDAILKRAHWSHQAAYEIVKTTSPMMFAQNALGESLTSATRMAISRAQDSHQGIVLALMSPEFQRR